MQKVVVFNSNHILKNLALDMPNYYLYSRNMSEFDLWRKEKPDVVVCDDSDINRAVKKLMAKHGTKVLSFEKDFKYKDYLGVDFLKFYPEVSSEYINTELVYFGQDRSYLRLVEQKRSMLFGIPGTPRSCGHVPDSEKRKIYSSVKCAIIDSQEEFLIAKRCGVKEMIIANNVDKTQEVLSWKTQGEKLWKVLQS